MADLVGPEFWVIEESEIEIHPFTVRRASCHDRHGALPVLLKIACISKRVRAA